MEEFFLNILFPFLRTPRAIYSIPHGISKEQLLNKTAFKWQTRLSSYG